MCGLLQSSLATIVAVFLYTAFFHLFHNQFVVGWKPSLKNSYNSQIKNSGLFQAVGIVDTAEDYQKLEALFKLWL